MVTLKDVENNTFSTSSFRFEYLLAACKAEQQTLLREQDNAHDNNFDGIINVVEHSSTCKNNKPKPGLKIRIVEVEEEMKPISSVGESTCLPKLRMLGKVSIKPRTNAPESNPSPKGKRKISENEGEAAKMKITNPNNKRKRGGSSGGGGDNHSQELPPGLPEKIRNLMLHLPENRAVSGAKLLIEKQLTGTDVSGGHNRLSIPRTHLQETAFLTEEEEVRLGTRKGKNVGSIAVPLITPAMEMATVSLRRWDMNKPSGPPSICYVLTGSWNKIREDNGLEKGMVVQLWVIRIDGHLCLALTSLL